VVGIGGKEADAMPSGKKRKVGDRRARACSDERWAGENICYLLEELAS
jgi:hypothetical protein